MIGKPNIMAKVSRSRPSWRTSLVMMAPSLRDAPGVTAAAAFGTTLHVCGPDREALQRAIQPFRDDPRLTWDEAEPTLEDVFIHLMGQARDNALED